MKSGKLHIGTFTKSDDMKVSRKVAREVELQNATGWISKHKVHKSVKDYTRKPKHKNELY